MSALGWRLALVMLVAVGIAWGEWALYAKGRESGRAEVQARWDREVRHAEDAARALAEAQQKAMAQTMARYDKQTARERVVYRDIIKEVPTYVPSDLPVLPGPFRVLHDAAATGSPLPEAGGPSGVDAAAVAARDLAATLSENYARCHSDQQRLRALQEILSKNSE